MRQLNFMINKEQIICYTLTPEIFPLEIEMICLDFGNINPFIYRGIKGVGKNNYAKQFVDDCIANICIPLDQMFKDLIYFIIDDGDNLLMFKMKLPKNIPTIKKVQHYMTVANDVLLEYHKECLANHDSSTKLKNIISMEKFDGDMIDGVEIPTPQGDIEEFMYSYFRELFS